MKMAIFYCKIAETFAEPGKKTKKKKHWHTKICVIDDCGHPKSTSCKEAITVWTDLI